MHLSGGPLSWKPLQSHPVEDCFLLNHTLPVAPVTGFLPPLYAALFCGPFFLGDMAGASSVLTLRLLTSGPCLLLWIQFLLSTHDPQMSISWLDSSLARIVLDSNFLDVSRTSKLIWLKKAMNLYQTPLKNQQVNNCLCLLFTSLCFVWNCLPPNPGISSFLHVKDLPLVIILSCYFSNLSFSALSHCHHINIICFSVS